MKHEVAPYKGWARALHITNGDVELVVTLDVGPRILKYAYAGGPNLLKEIPAQMGTSGEPQWVMRGGHRLWASPEDPAYTYSHDNHAADHGSEGHEVWVRSKPDPKCGLSYEFRLSLEPHGSGLRLQHAVINNSAKSYHVAPWALTVFAPGGEAIIPLPLAHPHPGDHGLNAADFGPQMALVLWPYFRFTDKRFVFGERCIRIKQDPQAAGPAKIGARLPTPWAAYHRQNTLFVKRFAFDASVVYPDGGCNFETYTDAGVLELETLGGLGTLAPGASAHHTETWSLHKNVVLPADEISLEQTLAPLVTQTLQP